MYELKSEVFNMICKLYILQYIRLMQEDTQDLAQRGAYCPTKLNCCIYVGQSALMQTCQNLGLFTASVLNF